MAGVLLALFTFGVMTVGPGLVGFIPNMMVGVLIFSLGFELLLEAIWLPRKKLNGFEYATVSFLSSTFPITTDDSRSSSSYW